ncbi:nitroreductase [Formicincola oecophyllae]|uniref:Nitroreductase n=1 Tax=Formicincola oecophyllae TaxID=2558361 RepID=A0A4Y6U6Q8_9PROT|nr:nitroreductase [Formicincola oecophyllae]QDH13049.1 nitroreductase [Formicincola oecophyllae]
MTTPHHTTNPLEAPFHELVRKRRALRAFKPDPVPDDVLRSVLEDAQHTPSQCNTQPWQMHIVSGKARDELSAAIQAEEKIGHRTPDFTFARTDYPALYEARAQHQGAEYYKALGIPREDKAARRDVMWRNYTFFGAPHVALLFMPQVGDDVRIAGDLGMYGQTFLLSLAAHGLGGCPQTYLGFYAGTIRKVLGIDENSKMLFGVSFGYPDMTAPANSVYKIGRAPLKDSVTFHS